MDCPTCNHSNKKEPEAVHAAGQCDRCNCGQSEIIHLPPMSGAYRVESMKPPADGTYRTFEAPRAA